MDLLDRLLEHDVWTTGQLMMRCHELTEMELDRQFGIGHRSVRATLRHIIANMEVWSALMAGVAIPAASRSSASCSLEELAVRLDRAAAQLAAVAQPIAARGGWDERWLDVLDVPPQEKTYGGAIAHVITHSMHHRAQLLFMLQQLGMRGLPEGDVLSWERQRDQVSTKNF